MDFFAAQSRAIRTSRWLVLWFALCVLGVIAVLCALAGMTSSGSPWAPDLFLPIAVASSAIIGGGSAFKHMQLSAGGSVVARDLGGRQVDPGTRDLLERRLLNVVEEMSISSGVPMPEVWLMDQENGINAFAAGTDPSNAVIGVTRGCLERLDRAELQGVVAHEFSHILNGDMKLNMRLTGWIFGLVMISMLGRMMLESLRYARVRSSRDSGKAIAVIVLIGLAIWIVGWIGSMFAKLLQAAVSRQREYLADASAVQFTRHPEGLTGALKKIGGYQVGGKLNSPKAAEAGHFLFVSGLSSLFATHPPLDQRIRAIEPAWDGKMIESKRRQLFEPDAGDPRFAGFSDGSTAETEDIDAAVGTAVAAHWERDRLRADNPADAMAMVVGLLAANQNDSAGPVMGMAADRFGLPFAAMASRWMERLGTTPRHEWLALLDSQLPWLRRISRNDAEELLAATSQMIAADGKIDFFEFLLQKVLDRHVSLAHGLRALPAMKYRSLSELAAETAAIAGIFARAAGDPDAIAQAAREFSEHEGAPMPPPATDAGVAELSAALEKFDAATPLVKSRLLRLCGLIVSHDERATTDERELLRCVAEAIGAPIPPFVRSLENA
jgi:Zn-dependent protease with chaperone function